MAGGRPARSGRSPGSGCRLSAWSPPPRYGVPVCRCGCGCAGVWVRGGGVRVCGCAGMRVCRVPVCRCAGVSVRCAGVWVRRCAGVL